MIEGQERAQVDWFTDQITINNLLVKPVFMADMDESARQKQMASIEDFLSQRNTKIERDHRDDDNPDYKQEMAQAEAFKKFFAERRKLNGNV